MKKCENCVNWRTDDGCRWCDKGILPHDGCKAYEKKLSAVEMVKFTMTFSTSKKNSNDGAYHKHMMPLTFYECMMILNGHINRGYTINNLTVKRV